MRQNERMTDELLNRQMRIIKNEKSNLLKKETITSTIDKTSDRVSGHGIYIE